ncbi:MAG: hypothetical protein VKL42_15710 [Snowella sp.]|nr:hypothetical protein [Snowella sp.]
MFDNIMKESAFYQDILQEGRQEGLEQGKLEAKLEMVSVLKRLGLTLEQIAQELELDLVLVQQFVAGQQN